MKTKVTYLATKITVAVVLLALIVVKATAAEAPNLKMVPHTDERAIVLVENPGNSYAELTIEDSNGEILYYREGKINEKNYSKIFDFKNLANGDYRIIVENSAGKKELLFTVENNTVVVNEMLSSNTPYFNVENDILKISYLNHTMNNIALTLSNNEGEVFSKSLGNDFSITTGFNLSKLNKGDYAVSINDGRRSYTYTFEK
ncbi:MAG: hypothetical protein JW735_11720 [Prolixibacteraceae bacterium]|jgi:hypothetical protein|nr:hypothetical protein [Prolixibacteraceae bacterium]